MNITLVKKIDRFIGELLVLLLPSPAMGIPLVTPSRFLVIRPGGIGDAALLAPTLTLLKKTFPTAHITVLAEQRNAGLFELLPEVDTLFLYDRPRQLFSAIRYSYDVVIDTEQWHRLSAIVTRCISAPVTIGFNTNRRRTMFTNSIAYSQEEYEVDSFMHLLAPFGGLPLDNPALAGEPFLQVPAFAEQRALALLAPLRSKVFITIFPGASITERRWGGERFRQVANCLCERGYGVVVVGGKEDVICGKEITVGNSGITIAGVTTLAETAAVIQKSSVLLSGDSGILHIAVGLGVPTVSLFGSGRAAKWAPQGVRHRVINKQLPCAPCTTFGTTPPCPHKVACMENITADEVVSAILGIFD